MSTTQPLSPLSSNLQKWRIRRGLSLSKLAREAGISKSTVSELERGNGNPSLDTMWALARALNVSLGALFVSPPTREASPVLRLVEAPVMVDDHGFMAKLLANWSGRGEVEVCMVQLSAGGRRNSRGNAAGVIERSICVEGVVEIQTDEGSVVLNLGDMITFAADQRHSYQSLGGDACLVVVQQYPYNS